MASWSNDSKNSTSFTNKAFTALQTWAQSVGTWGENTGVRWIQGIAYKHRAKNSTSFTNETKS